MLRRLALSIALAAGADPAAFPPSLTVDLDGDGKAETVSAVPGHGAVRIEVREAAGRKTAETKAPDADADVVRVTLMSAALGSVGSLLEVSASTDASECVSVWRYRDAKLARLPIRSASGQPLPDCGASGVWSYAWEHEAEGRPSVLVRERTLRSHQGVLRIREVFDFAGFSLDFAPKLSACEINGVPIPSWYPATLYTRAALERLYGRFDLASFRREPTLSILMDRERGVFALRFSGPGGEVLAPVDGYAALAGAVTLEARAGEKTAHVSVRLAADGSVPYEVRVEGLGPALDEVYAPAGSWRGGSRQVFPSAADELASEDLAGVWGDPNGENTTIAIEGSPPYRVRVGKELFALHLDPAGAAVDAILYPIEAGGHPWGLVLRGQNAVDRIPLDCSGQGADRRCNADGEAVRLRRIGALVNVR